MIIEGQAEINEYDLHRLNVNFSNLMPFLNIDQGI